jgi:hypothetical protein
MAPDFVRPSSGLPLPRVPGLDAFSTDYAQARERFLAAAAAAGAATRSDLHPLKGRAGETLALDVAVLGDPEAAQRLLVSSGCHGVEGFCGSGVQLAALQDSSLLGQARQHGVTLVLAHALNPWGFSHIRRVTHENVDLNRNFQDFSQPLPVNAGYAQLHSLLLPQHWPPDAENQAAMAQWIELRGMGFVQEAVTSGQYAFSDGLFFGGSAPTWSNGAVRRLLRQHTSGARQLGWIDLHTGLGPSGHGERIFSHAASVAAVAGEEDPFARASRWWGAAGPLTRAEDGSSSSARLNGTMSEAAAQECPDTQTTKITLEFGTLEGLDMLLALRAEQWLQQHPKVGEAKRQRIKRQLLDAFFVDRPGWKSSVLEQGLSAIREGLAGLGNR